ncbi:hypothetical protein pb186bvf_002147 [Paramecium bursaria]
MGMIIVLIKTMLKDNLNRMQGQKRANNVPFQQIRSVQKLGQQPSYHRPSSEQYQQ